MPEARRHEVSLAKVLDAEIERLQRCRGWIRRVDRDFFRARKKCFSSDLEFVRWLSTPHADLKGRAPIEIMHARDGKSLVHGFLLRMCLAKPQRARRDRVRQWRRFIAYIKRMPKTPPSFLQEAIDEIRER